MMSDQPKSARRKNRRRGSNQGSGSSGGNEQSQGTCISEGTSNIVKNQSSQVINNISSQKDKSQGHPSSTTKSSQGKVQDEKKHQTLKNENKLSTVTIVQNDKPSNTNLCKKIPVKETDLKTKNVVNSPTSQKSVDSLHNPIKKSNDGPVTQPVTDAVSKLDNSIKPNKQKSADDNTTPASIKSKAELRAERRAVQEAQRAAKQSKKEDVKGVKSTNTSFTPPITKVGITADGNKKTVETSSDKGIVTKAPVKAKTTSLTNVKLFSHLQPYKRSISVIQAAKEGIHPAIVRLGLQYAEGIVCGSNARCTALIHAFMEVFRDFKTPESKDLSHALTSLHIEPSMRFLEKCRPVSVGMTVICKKIVEEITELPKDLSEEEAKKRLENVLSNILVDDIEKAHDSIINLAKGKITTNDVILIYGWSYIVKRVLTEAHKVVKFRVIVVDARPKLEGRSMLHYLTQQRIECTYVLINAVAHVMQKATKVFLGAHALLANGYVKSRVGSSQIALVAKAFNKPVLVCCETFKFSELVQTDSFVFNELGNPDDLVETQRLNNPLAEWQDMKSLNILNPNYDVTPPDLVTVIINDAHLVPCTSVPVLLRVKPSRR